jgi:hypothetical protein
MKRLARILVLVTLLLFGALEFPPSVHSQTTGTVGILTNQTQVLTNQTSIGTFVIPAINNIGQGSHYLAYCYNGNNTTFLKIWLEESFDGSTNWIPISSAGTTTGTSLGNGSCNIIQGGGYYNHIRVNLNQLGGPSPSVNAWYSESAAPIPFVQFAQGSNGVFVPTGCDSQTWQTVANNTNAVLKGLATAGGQIYVCSIVITFNSATPTATGLITIYPNNLGNNCATPGGFLAKYFTSTSNPITLGSGLGAILIGGIGQDLCVQNSATGVTAMVSISYAMY